MALTEHAQHSQQLASPIFGRLPAELRAMVFVEVFGRRRVHMEFMPHPTRADKLGNTRRWRHGICAYEMGCSFDRVIARSHFCLTSARRRLLDTALLLTCWRA